MVNKMMQPDFEESNKSSFWDQLIRPRPFILGFLIFLGLLLQFDIHYYQNISSAYTHFFYLIIVFAGLWYQKKAVWIALIFSFLYLLLEYLPPYSLSLDSVFRATMLCLVAMVIGNITDRILILQQGLQRQHDDLKQSHHALELGNKKLNMLSSITRHDILNQLMILQGYLDFSIETVTNLDISGYLENCQKAAKTIEKQITFTKYYQNIGVQAPFWQDVEEYIKNSVIELRIVDITVDIMFTDLEVYADQLIQKVFYNLMENSLRHGGKITRISFSFLEMSNKGILVYQDDGVGISQEDKKHLFERGFGKHTGLGLFLSREILSITGITIDEKGEPEQGVRFEITIPSDNYQLKENYGRVNQILNSSNVS